MAVGHEYTRFFTMLPQLTELKLTGERSALAQATGVARCCELGDLSRDVLQRRLDVQSYLDPRCTLLGLVQFHGQSLILVVGHSVGTAWLIVYIWIQKVTLSIISGQLCKNTDGHADPR